MRQQSSACPCLFSSLKVSTMAELVKDTKPLSLSPIQNAERTENLISFFPHFSRRIEAPKPQPSESATMVGLAMVLIPKSLPEPPTSIHLHSEPLSELELHHKQSSFDLQTGRAELISKHMIAPH
ncbi:hypothetical protein C1H46_030396 [Malus baccata]|uniref:Uncharacterized protein n=1 Tax=Malus baccata TaxID=106549 RepID=A0A540LC74_MALBA|nr:hypothetical protein C1H46_030396 [Malus baccata]